MKWKWMVPAWMFLASMLLAQEIKRDEAVENYRQQISALNLVNALYLTEPQTERFLKILNDLETTQAEYQKRYVELIPGMKKEYKKLLQEIADNKGISKETQTTAGGVHLKELEMRDSYLAKLCELETRLDAVLSDNQKCIVEDFKPCLIPPKNLRDPARVGQAVGDASGAVDLLERMRKIPERRYAKAKGTMVEKYMDKYEEKIRLLTPEEKKQELTRVEEIVDQARAMSEVDFQMKKEDLGKQLLIEPLKSPRKKNELGKVGRILLDTRLIPVFEKRLASVKF